MAFYLIAAMLAWMPPGNSAVSTTPAAGVNEGVDRDAFPALNPGELVAFCWNDQILPNGPRIEGNQHAFISFSFYLTPRGGVLTDSERSLITQQWSRLIASKDDHPRLTVQCDFYDHSDEEYEKRLKVSKYLKTENSQLTMVEFHPQGDWLSSSIDAQPHPSRR